MPGANLARTVPAVSGTKACKMKKYAIGIPVNDATDVGPPLLPKRVFGIYSGLVERGELLYVEKVMKLLDIWDSL